MMDLVAFVENVAHHFRRWRIDNGGRYHVSHVSMILIFGYLKLRVGVELTDGCKMHITPGNVSKHL